MSLMDSIRQSTDSTAMRLVFGAILVVFIFFGISGGGGTPTVVVAEVNGERITDSTLNREVRMAARGEALDDKEEKQLARDVRDQLIQKVLLRQEARRLGLDVSDQEVARYILTSPNHLDSEGNFSRKLYEATIRNMGLKEGAFEELIREDLLLTKLQRVAIAGVNVSDAQVKAMLDAQLTQMTARWVLLTDDLLKSAVPVEQAEIDRKLSEEEKLVRAQYDRELKTRWTVEKKAKVHRISLLRNLSEGGATDVELRQRLDKILAEAKAGADFATLARKYSEDLTAVNGGTQGNLTEVQLGPVAGPAVFSVGAGAFTEVLESATAFEIYKVDEMVEGRVTAYEEAKTQIAREMIQAEKLPTFADQAAKELLAGWKATGTPPADVLARLNTKERTTDPFPPGQPRLPGAGSSEALNAALKSAKAPGVLDQVFTATNGRVVLEVLSITPPDPGMLELYQQIARPQLEREAQQTYIQRWLESLEASAKVVRHDVL